VVIIGEKYRKRIWQYNTEPRVWGATFAKLYLILSPLAIKRKELAALFIKAASSFFAYFVFPFDFESLEEKLVQIN